MAEQSIITSPHDGELGTLCRALEERAAELDASGRWPAEQLALLAAGGVFGWFVPTEAGGQGWSERDLAKGYMRLAASCLTTTFILTQWVAACRRIVASEYDGPKALLLSGLAAGRAFTTVGISHLTTSRRHLGRPAMVAREEGGGFVLDGYSAWVTGARHASSIVLGATLEDGRQLLVAMPADSRGIEFPQPAKLLALAASHTGEVRCHGTRVDRQWLLAGPVENVLALPSSGGGAGGLPTSALAIGLATAAIGYLRQEGRERPDLAASAESLAAEARQLEKTLLDLTDPPPSATPDEGRSETARPQSAVDQHPPAPLRPLNRRTRRGAVQGSSATASAMDNDLLAEPPSTPAELRARANSLALRASQAALAAAKGAGFVEGHPAGRWCREALFFLVWSCPQEVMLANLCELAGLRE